VTVQVSQVTYSLKQLIIGYPIEKRSLKKHLKLGESQLLSLFFVFVDNEKVAHISNGHLFHDKCRHSIYHVFSSSLRSLFYFLEIQAKSD
jgi:hypothetical protein